VDRVAGIRNEHRVAAVERREHQVREPFLGADRDDRFLVHVEVHVPAALVPLRDGAAQARNALRDRIAVRILALGHFHELVDDVPRRRAVRVAHREVDDVLAGTARRHLQLVRDVEDVRGQPLDAGEFGGDGYCRVLEIHGAKAMLRCKIRFYRGRGTRLTR
jgi:hypothetical protein